MRLCSGYERHTARIPRTGHRGGHRRARADAQGAVGAGHRTGPPRQQLDAGRRDGPAHLDGLRLGAPDGRGRPGGPRALRQDHADPAGHPDRGAGGAASPSPGDLPGAHPRLLLGRGARGGRRPGARRLRPARGANRRRPGPPLKGSARRSHPRLPRSPAAHPAGPLPRRSWARGLGPRDADPHRRLAAAALLRRARPGAGQHPEGAGPTPLHRGREDLGERRRAGRAGLPGGRRDHHRAA